MPNVPSAPPDHLIVTAANDAQAVGYRAQLDLRTRTGQLSPTTRTFVVTDPAGKRAGSGGSTLVALHRLAESLAGSGSLAERLKGLRVLILHAGGDSKRLPAYAAHGKLFTPLPCPGPALQPSALFDLLLANLLRIAKPAGGHVLVASGDVLLTFDPAEVSFDRPGVTGVAYPDDVDRAARHGVYVLDREGRVADFLQKPNEVELRHRGAIDPAGRSLIDTGLLSFDPAAVERLCNAAGLVISDGQLVCKPGLLADLEAGHGGEIDLYEEITLALAENLPEEQYERRVLFLPRNAAPARQTLIRRLYRSLHGTPFQACVLSWCDFFHLGSSRELLAGLVSRSRTSSTYHFHNRTATVAPPGWPEDLAFVFNSVLDHAPAACGPGVLLEGVRSRSVLHLAGRNILTGLSGEVTQPIRLPEMTGMAMLPFGRKDEWAVVVYGIDDDFGSPQGSSRCTFLNAPLAAFLLRHGLNTDALWPEGGTSLFHAKLWCVGAADAVVAHALWMFDEHSDAPAVAAWCRHRRVSMADLLHEVDHERLLAHQAELCRLAALERPFARIVSEPDLSARTLTEQLQTRDEAASLLRDLTHGIEASPPPDLRARALLLALLTIRRVLELPDDAASPSQFDDAVQRLTPGDPATAAERLETAASLAVADAVRLNVTPARHALTACVAHDQVIWATAPARLDFSGGWSDTPPICNDRGGTVVNAAVKLNGQYPIQAVVKLNEEFVINLTSIDLGRRITITTIEELLAYTDPRDWTSLPKACLFLAGMTAGAAAGDLRAVLRRLGGGIDLNLFCALPKGSGLGTSSILGATVLSCLARLVGDPLGHDGLINRTLLLEQMMTTGGGWQDQIGGVLPGVKLIRTNPGPEQTPSVFWLAFDEASMRERMLLYYTGYRRLARDILRNVVHNYLARDPQILRTIERLKEGALALRQHIDTHDTEGFGACVSRYWELKKQIDPGATTPAIEELAALVAPYCNGYTLLGAGGGGFLFMVARSQDDAGRLRRLLSERPNATGARFFDMTLDTQGLQVAVL